MKETCISTNTLATEFAGSRLIRMFNTFSESPGAKRTRLTASNKDQTYFNYNVKKYTITDISKKLLEFLSNEDWSNAGNKTTFNTIQLLDKYGLVKRFYSKDSEKKHKAYLKLIDNSKFYIRNQDQFHYALVSELHGWFVKHSRQDIISDLFYYSGSNGTDGIAFVNEDKISIENTEKTSGGFLRTDMAFNVRGYKIVVEYLESQHDQDKLLGHEFDRVRALRLLGDTSVQSYQIAHIAFFWQKHLQSTGVSLALQEPQGKAGVSPSLIEPQGKRYTFNTKPFYDFVQHIGQTILDYYLISDEDAYCINKLTQITGNQSLSEQIYLAHNNQNCPVISLETLEQIFRWAKHPNPKVSMEKVWYGEFVDRVKLMQLEILAMKSREQANASAFDSIFDSESDSDTDSVNEDEPFDKTQIPDDKLIYYEIKDGAVYLTHFGLHVYIDMGPKYLANMYEYFKIRKFYNDITSGLINAIKEIRTIKESQQSNQIYGL
jgi:hypothetical protein